MQSEHPKAAPLPTWSPPCRAKLRSVVNRFCWKGSRREGCTCLPFGNEGCARQVPKRLSEWTLGAAAVTRLMKRTAQTRHVISLLQYKYCNPLYGAGLQGAFPIHSIQQQHGGSPPRALHVPSIPTRHGHGCRDAPMGTEHTERFVPPPVAPWLQTFLQGVKC